LDASSSVDKDVTAGNDTLSYERSFSNTNQAKIEQSYDNNKSIVVSFEDIGKYKAKLTVSDSYGKITTLEKDIEVVSSLRPVVYAAPRATVWGQPITFVVKANDNIINYEWDF
jgi:PKD repeat protein